MNRLFQFIIRKMDARCRVWEAGLESGRRIPDEETETLIFRNIWIYRFRGQKAFRWQWTSSGQKPGTFAPFLLL